MPRYIMDQAVSSTSGILWDMESYSIDIGSGAKAIAFAPDLASTANAAGASLIGIEDAASSLTATNVEDALAELAAGQFTVFTGGDGIDYSSDVVSVDLSVEADGTTAITLSNQTTSAYDGTYARVVGKTFQIDSSDVLTNSIYASYSKDAGGGNYHVLIHNLSSGEWTLYTSTTAPSGWSNGNDLTGQLSANETLNVSVPSAQTALSDGQFAPLGTDANIDYPQEGAPFLSFDNGRLKADVLDEDDMSSDSDAHMATQQSIKAYVDTSLAAPVQDISDHLAVLGVADGDTDLGNPSGDIITSNVSVKTALEELETAIEALNVDTSGGRLFFHVPVVFSDSGVVVIRADVPATAQILSARCLVTSAFDGTFAVTVGHSGASDAIAKVGDFDLTDASAVNNPQIHETWYPNNALQDFNVTVTGTATQGAAMIAIEFVI